MKTFPKVEKIHGNGGSTSAKHIKIPSGFMDTEQMAKLCPVSCTFMWMCQSLDFMIRYQFLHVSYTAQVI